MHSSLLTRAGSLAAAAVIATTGAMATAGAAGPPPRTRGGCPLADPGDAVVLEVQAVTGRWVYVQASRLGADDQAGFSVPTGRRARQYRVVLLPPRLTACR